MNTKRRAPFNKASSSGTESPDAPDSGRGLLQG
jgi:hypothetical protein